MRSIYFEGTGLPEGLAFSTFRALGVYGCNVQGLGSMGALNVYAYWHVFGILTQKGLVPEATGFRV